MSDTVKVVIEIPKEVKADIDNGVIRQNIDKIYLALAHGTPLDDVKAEIQAKYDSIPWRNNEYDDGWIEALEWVLFSILDNIGKAESEDT